MTHRTYYLMCPAPLLTFLGRPDCGMCVACSEGVFQIESSYECRRKRTASTIFTSLFRQSTAAIVTMATNQSRLRRVATELHGSIELFVHLAVRSGSCKPDVPDVNGVNVFLLSLPCQHVMSAVQLGI